MTYILSFFTEDGIPKTGLVPTIRIRNVSTGALVITDESMNEIGDGFYKYNFQTYESGVDYAIRSDSGSILTGNDRYVFAGNDAIQETVKGGGFALSADQILLFKKLTGAIEDLLDKSDKKIAQEIESNLLNVVKDNKKINLNNKKEFKKIKTDMKNIVKEIKSSKKEVSSFKKIKVPDNKKEFEQLNKLFNELKDKEYVQDYSPILKELSEINTNVLETQAKIHNNFEDVNKSNKQTFDKLELLGVNLQILKQQTNTNLVQNELSLNNKLTKLNELIKAIGTKLNVVDEDSNIMNTNLMKQIDEVSNKVLKLKGAKEQNEIILARINTIEDSLNNMNINHNDRFNKIHTEFNDNINDVKLNLSDYKIHVNNKVDKLFDMSNKVNDVKFNNLKSENNSNLNKLNDSLCKLNDELKSTQNDLKNEFEVVDTKFKEVTKDLAKAEKMKKRKDRLNKINEQINYLSGEKNDRN